MPVSASWGASCPRRTWCLCVLLTSLPLDRYEAAALLREYKDQTSVEQRCHFPKDPAFVDAVFLKKPERTEALGYVMMLALLLLPVPSADIVAPRLSFSREGLFETDRLRYPVRSAF